MNHNFLRIAGFLLLLTLYTTLTIILSRALPFLLLGGLLAWFIVRRPLSRPGRLDNDIQIFAAKTGGLMHRALRVLLSPLAPP